MVSDVSNCLELINLFPGDDKSRKRSEHSLFPKISLDYQISNRITMITHHAIGLQIQHRQLNE